MREFKKVKRLNGIEIKLPKRSTELSAGYDFFAPEDVIVLPMKANSQPILVRTGIKAYMPKDEFLMICNRSSNPAKKHLVVPNGIGVVDSDYVDNPDNEGEIGFLFYNLSDEMVFIKKGDKLGQGIFVKFATTDDDDASGKREGGFGSTGK